MSDFTAVSALFSGTDIFVIPTFQRPYFWEDAQWDDLLRDIRFAAGRLKTNWNTTHYFGTIHTIKVEPDSQLFETFTDQENQDKNIKGIEFCPEREIPQCPSGRRWPAAVDLFLYIA